MALFDFGNKKKFEELKKYLEEENYNAAARVADQIPLHKAKSISELNLLGKAYKKHEDFFLAKDVFERSYAQRCSRVVLIDLIECCLELKDLDSAESYFNEYQKLVPDDKVTLYKYRYEIEKRKGRERHLLITILEELKMLRYIEEYAYELAYQYHKEGMRRQCVNECEEIILWFGVGEVVERARILLAYYKGEVGLEAVESTETYDTKRQETTNENTKSKEEEWIAKKAESIRAEVRRIEEAANFRDEVRRVEQETRAREEARRAEKAAREQEEAKRAKEIAKAREEIKRAEEERKAREEARYAEEMAKEEAKRAKEILRFKEESRRLEEIAKAKEETKRAEEIAKAKEEARRAEEMAKAKEEVKRAEEAVARAKEEARRIEETIKVQEQAACAKEEEIQPKFFSIPASDAKECLEEHKKVANLLLKKQVSLQDTLGNFERVSNIQEQVINSIDLVLEDKENSYFVIAGKEKSGKTTLAFSMIKLLFKLGIVSYDRTATIDAKQLNQISLKDYGSQLKNCNLVIEHAASMTEKTIASLLEFSAGKKGKTCVVLEELDSQMDDFLSSEKEWTSLFYNRILLENYSAKELMEMAYDYITKEDYSIDSVAAQVLYDKIDAIVNLQGKASALSSVMELVKETLCHAEQRVSNTLLHMVTNGEIQTGNYLVILPEDIM